MPNGLSLRRSGSGILRFLSLLVAASLAAALLLPLAGVREVRAWSTDPEANTAICTKANDQSGPVATSDGSGGAIIVWQDMRNGWFDIYA